MTTTAAVEVTQSIDEMIGARVHHLMWRHRISQVQMAPHLGIKQSGLSKKLRGLAPWTVTDVYAAASALGVDPQDLLPRLDSNQQPFD